MSFYKKISLPEDKRVFFVGDIHGAFDLYQKGCKDLGISEDDVVVSLGDLIDRGDKNFKTVVEFTRKDNRYAIKGNHEDLMIKGMLEGSGSHYGCWMMNGGCDTWDELGGELGCIALAEMVKDLPTILEISHKGKSFACIHAGVPFYNKDWGYILNKVSQSTQYRVDLVWDRSVIDEIKYLMSCEKDPEESVPAIEGVNFVLHGHTPVKTPLVVNNRVYMDTGGVFNSRLTFAWYENNKLNFYTTGDWDEV